jgi:hypothetical protein
MKRIIQTFVKALMALQSNTVAILCIVYKFLFNYSINFCYMKKVFFDFRDIGRVSSTNELFTKELAQTVGIFLKFKRGGLKILKKPICYYSGMFSCLLVLLIKKIFYTNTRNLILSAVVFLCSMQVFGQGYQSFFGTRTTNYHIFTPMTCYTSEKDSTNLLGCGVTSEYLITKEDTIMVGDTIYYNTPDRYPNNNIFIREDTVSGQLFRYIKEFNREFLICDMSLNTGDTFRLPKCNDCPDSHEYYLNYSYREEGEEIVVDSIVYINGKKVIYFSGMIESNYYHYYDGFDYYRRYFFLTFIEGVGPTYGPFGYVYNGERLLSVLLCVEKDDTLTHITSPELGCYQFGVSIEKIETNPFRLYPTPANDKIHLELNGEEFVNGAVRIIDPVGQIVYNNVLMSIKEIIPIAHLSSGIYVLQYTFNKQTFQTKFLKIK